MVLRNPFFRQLAPLVAGCLVGLSSLACGQAQAPLPAVPGAISISEARQRERLNQEVIIRGTVRDYRTPTSDRAPHKFTISDETGTMAVAIWPVNWEGVPFNTKLMTDSNLGVTVRVRLRLWRNEVEGHIMSPLDIVEGFQAPAEAAPVQWLNSVPEALSRSQATSRPILVFFTSPTGESSQFVEQTIFGDKRVRSLIATQWIPVKIDMTNQQDVAQRLQVFRGGVVNLYGPDASFRRSLPNLRRPEELIRELEGPPSPPRP
jgi:hypothetical protein